MYFLLVLQHMEDIKKLNGETVQPSVENAKYGAIRATKRKPRPEIEELDQELRAIKRVKGKKGGKGARKLYHHEGMFQNLIHAEHIESSEMHAKKGFARNDQRLGKRTPMRAAKSSNISYT